MLLSKTSVWSDIHSLHPLFFQMIQIFIHIGSLRMSLRITCTADTEISCLFDLADQFNRMVILIRKRKIRVCRNIPAKCKDVFDSALFQLMDYSMYLSLVEETQVRCAIAGTP